MAPKRKGTEDTIDKRNLRRPQIVLRTLPPIVFTSPTNPLAFQLTMSVAEVKPQILPAPAPEPAARPSYEREFGVNTHEPYKKPEFVQEQFKLVDDRVDNVKKELKGALKDARNAIDEKIGGLETRLTNKIDAQKVYIDDKFEQQEKRFNTRTTLLETKLEVTLGEHTESFVAMDKRFTKVETRLDTIEEDMGSMKKDISEIKEMLRDLLGVDVKVIPATPLPSASSQEPSLADAPQVVVDSAPVAGPSNTDEVLEARLVLRKSPSFWKSFKRVLRP